MTMTIEAIEQLEADRWAANLAGDIDRLDALLSDRLEYIHPTSKIDTKQSFLDNLRQHNPYLKHEVLEQRVLLLDHAAVLTKSFRSTARRKPPENLTVVVEVLSTAVWAPEGGDWRLIRYQTTFIPT